MEEARSVGLRRVERVFAPDRMADAILSMAFDQLTRDAVAIRRDGSSVQNEPSQDGFEVPSVPEVMR
jgi:hypothetical protein